MTTCVLRLRPGNGIVIELGPLSNSVTDAVDTGATVNARIQYLNGIDITGRSWPVVLNHDAAGVYRATIIDDVDINAGQQYRVVVNALGSGGETGQWTEVITAEVRGAS